MSDILDAQTSMAVTTPERSEKDTTLSEDERSNLKKSGELTNGALINGVALRNSHLNLQR